MKIPPEPVVDSTPALLNNVCAILRFFFFYSLFRWGFFFCVSDKDKQRLYSIYYDAHIPRPAMIMHSFASEEWGRGEHAVPPEVPHDHQRAGGKDKIMGWAVYIAPCVFFYRYRLMIRRDFFFLEYILLLKKTIIDDCKVDGCRH